jgi:predicted GNAT family N-acyltransferase
VTRTVRRPRDEEELAAALALRLCVRALYRRAGFRPYGERFDEEGIEHLGMEMDL